jgi:uncharacterized membrane protein YhaH (DUF805 family)
MTFGQAILGCLRNYATFAGRASRSEFWWFFLFQIMISVAASTISQQLGSLVNLALLLPALAVGARRLHDIGKSGWWQLLILTGIGLVLLIYWWIQPMDEQISAN